MPEDLRFKYLVHLIDERAGTRRPELLSVSASRGVVRRSSITDAEPRADDLSIYKVCEPGDLVINRMSAYQGALGVAAETGLVSPDYLVLRPALIVHSRYLHHLGRSRHFVAEMASRLRGIGGEGVSNVRTPRINFEDLGEIRVTLPSFDDQRRIADFLDGQVARLDRALELRHHQIRLERERFLASVTTAYEDEAHRCGTVRLGLLLQGLEQGWSPQCEDRPAEQHEYGVLKAGCVNGGVFHPEQHKALPATVMPRLEYLVRPGDLLMSRASGSLDLIGSAALAPLDMPANLILCDKVYRLSLLPDVVPLYAAHMLRSHPVREAIKLGTSGAEGMANNLPSGIVRGLRIPSVSSAGQERVADQLSESERHFNQVVSLLTRSLALLRERKHAVISAAVAGDLNVLIARSAA